MSGNSAGASITHHTRHIVAPHHGPRVPRRVHARAMLGAPELAHAGATARKLQPRSHAKAPARALRQPRSRSASSPCIAEMVEDGGSIGVGRC